MARKASVFLAFLLLVSALGGPAFSEGLPGRAPDPLPSGLSSFEPLDTPSYLLSMDEAEGLLALLSQSMEAPDAARLTLYDLKAGEVLAVRDLTEEPGLLNLSVLSESRVGVVNWQTLETRIYDADLRELIHFAGRERDRFYDPLIDGEGSFLYALSADGGSIAGFPLTGQGGIFLHKAPLNGNWAISQLMGFSEGNLLYALSDRLGKTVINALSPEGRILGAYAVPEGFYRFSDSDTLFSSGSDGQRWFFDPLRGPDIECFSQWREEEYPVAASGPLLASWQTGEGEGVRLYDRDRGLITASLPGRLFGEGYLERMHLSKEGYAVLVFWEAAQDGPSFFRWDYGVLPENRNAGRVTDSLEQVRQENRQTADRIEETYGIRVYYGVSGNDFDDGVYVARQAEDPLQIRAALREIGEFCAAFPPGMLRELCVPPVTRVGLYLSGSIRPVSGEGIQSPGGFSSVSGNERAVVVNLFESGKLTQNLAHEFMHAMEDRLWERAYRKDTGRNMMLDWESLVPADLPGAGYAYSYHREDGTEYADTAYTYDDPEARADPRKLLYIDSYSRTYPLEDRARVFEHLFIASDGLPAYFTEPRLLFKARYLCAILREAFDSARSAPTLRWERFLPPSSYGELAPLLEAPELLAPAG